MFSVSKSAQGFVVVQPGREVGRAQLRNLRLLLDGLLAGGVRDVVLDLTGTEHVYYRVADLLAHIDISLRRGGGRLVLAGMNHYLENIFSVIGYVDRFEQVDSAADVGMLSPMR